MSMTDLWSCSLWEFGAAVDGWNKAQGAETVEPPTDAEVDAMLREHGFA